MRSEHAEQRVVKEAFYGHNNNLKWICVCVELQVLPKS